MQHPLTPPARFRLGLTLLAGLFYCGYGTAAEPTPPPLSAVTTRNDAASRLVNAWFAEGSAAGNRGDRYDNRDNGHSRLNLSVFPQLQPVAYTAEELAQHRNQGPALAVLPFPTLGNASLSAPASSGGSLPRILYLAPGGPRLLQTAYLSNNLYVYPEHEDHDPLHGDLYPLNTPYLLISQGSSSSDQPFLEAFALTLAAFSPEVKEELVRSRLLVPTLQFILRSCLKPVRSRDDYLSGLAHPAVFPPDWIDTGRMVQMAHQMVRAAIPPLAQIQVLSESPPAKPGIDFFEPPAISSEVLADEISVLGRVFRSRTAERVLRVSAAQSGDLLSRPLRIHWRLLRGDPDLVSLKPSPSGHEIEIRVRYHPQPLPVTGQPSLRSTRIDIGAFADNGISLSSPSFVSVFQIPSEERVFDEKGRLLQIEYQAHSRFFELPPPGSSRWAPFLERLWKTPADRTTLLLRQFLPDEDRAQVAASAAKLKAVSAARRQLESQLAQHQQALSQRRTRFESALAQANERKTPGAQEEAERRKQELNQAEKAYDLIATNVRNSQASLDRDWEKHLSSSEDQLRPLSAILSDLIERLVASPSLYPDQLPWIEEQARSSSKPEAATRLRQVRQRLLDRRVLLANRESPDQIVSFAPLSRPENQCYLRALNRTILANVLAPETFDYKAGDELADLRITVAKPWRDLFVYDSHTGELRGWQRIQQGQITQYDAQGRLLTPQGPVPVSYRVNPQTRLLEVVAPSSP